MPHLSIRLLGPIQVTLDGEPVTDFTTDKVRALLAFLAVESDRPHRRETLAGLLWGEFSENAARANLRSALANLRQAIRDTDASPPILLTTRQTIQHNPMGDCWDDVAAFGELARADATPEQMEEATTLYRGGFLDGFSIGDCPAFEEWALIQREQLARRQRALLSRLSDHYEAQVDYDRALAHAWRLVEMDRWQEDAHRRVMRLLALVGQRSAAMAQYESMQRILSEDLGIEPEVESRRLHEQIRSGDVEPMPRAPAPSVSTDREARSVGDCPYRGLFAFREADAPVFFGRERLVEQALEAVRRGPVVSFIVGSSGSGKSSTVFAGLVPELRGDPGWLIIQFRPGTHPLRSLTGALLAVLEPDLSESNALIQSGTLADAMQAGSTSLIDIVHRILDMHERASRLLLVVDQSEELFTLCTAPDIRHKFLDELLSASETAGALPSRSLSVLVTLRADFMGRALTHRALADALQDASMMMGPMSRDELRQAIEIPAHARGAAFEAGLVDRLLDDVGDEPGNLPLLEFALTLLWEGQTDGWLTHEGYEDIGRVDGALARYADDVLNGLDPDQREGARRVFEQLVHPGQGTEDTRRVATSAELGDRDWRLVQHLADKRLVVTGRDADGTEIVEVVHEALIQRWGQLGAWMNEDRAFRSWQEDLRTAIRAWSGGGHDEDVLLRGALLTQAEIWLSERRDELSDVECEFIAASADRQTGAEAQRDRRRRVTVLALAGGLIVALVLAVFAFDARNTARREAHINSSLVLAADAEEAQAVGQTDLALALALESVAVGDVPAESRRVLSSVSLGVGTRAILEGHEHPIRDAAMSADERLAVSGSCGEREPDGACTRGELIVWDLERGRNIARITGHSDWINAVAINPDASTALTGSADATLVMWDLVTGEMIRRFEGHDAGVRSVAIDADGTTALSGSDDGSMILWDLATGEIIRKLEGHSGPVNRIVFGPRAPDSPDRQTALSASGDTTMILWDVSTGKEIQRFEGHASAVVDAAIHPDGTSVLSVSNDLTLRAWDIETGVETNNHSFLAHPASVAIAPDGRTALVGVKTDVRLWDIDRWQENGRLRGHDVDSERIGEISSISMGSRGRLALSAGFDGTLRVWNMSSRRYLETDGAPIDALEISDDGSRLLTGMGTGETLLWDTDSGEVIRRFGGEGYGVAPACLSFGPTGSRGTPETVAMVCAMDAFGNSGDSSLDLWDIETGEHLRRFEGHVAYARAVAVSPDGRSALAGSQSLPTNEVGDLILWDLETGRQIRRFDLDHDVTNIAMSADGTRALTGSVTGFVAILWDVSTGREIRRFEDHALPVLNVAFGPQERTVLTASFDGTLIRWDIDTGEIIRRYLGHELPVWGLDISPDGRLMASSSDGGTVILWDLDTGEELRRFDAHRAPVPDIAFHPDGTTLFSGGFDGELIQWQVVDPTLDDLIEWTHANRYVRELTCEEREQYRLEPAGCEPGGSGP